MEAGAVNEHAENYEIIIKYIYMLFREVIKILNREIFVLEVERMARFFIKYGEKEHLQQIVDGKLRFTSSQTYIKIEEKQHNKGQGDLLEGKMKIKIEGKHFVSGEIKYYDYDMNPIQMYMFLTMGIEEIQTNKYLSMTYDNRYRHLLCKDVAFESQREYRFIGLDDLISNPVFYNFKYNGKYLIVPINDLMTKSIVVQ